MTRNTQTKGEKEKVQKTKSKILAAILTLTLVVSTGSLFVSVTNAQTTATPSQFLEYSSAWANGTVNVPNIGNITSMIITPVHQDKSSTIDNYDVLSLVLSSNLSTSATVVASISTNTNASDIAWRQALRNGSTAYMNLNGTVAVNNLLLVNPSELSIRKSASGTAVNVTVDFNPLTQINITLPEAQFPRGNFSTSWNVPAFHMEWRGVRNLTLGNATSNTSSGWREYEEFAGYSANYTLNVPSWNNYTTSGTTGIVREFNVHRGYAPTVVIPVNVTKAADFYNGFGQFTLNIPATGGITRMALQAIHVEQGTFGFPVDTLRVNLTAAGFNGFALAGFTTNQNTGWSLWQRTIWNGTSGYTQVGNNITIDNIFLMNASELTVRRNGTRLTVDFAPATPRNITLPVADFPRANFSATFTMPALHFDIDENGVSLFALSSSANSTSGWVQNNYYVAHPSNGTMRIPSINLVTSGVSDSPSSNATTILLPYMTSFYSGPLNPAIVPEFPAKTGFFIAIASLIAFTGALLLKKREKILKLH